MTYTREKLESMLREEVRRLCTKLGLVGYSKATKDECIEAILNAYGSEKNHNNDENNFYTNIPETDSDMEEEETKQSESGLSALQCNVTSVVTDKGEGNTYGNRITSTINVMCGAICKPFNVIGYSVAQVAEFLREALNIDFLSTYLVDGREVDGSYVLKEGDRRLEFVKSAGTKG